MITARQIMDTGAADVDIAMVAQRVEEELGRLVRSRLDARQVAAILNASTPSTAAATLRSFVPDLSSCLAAAEGLALLELAANHGA